jgi:hypothetical protein
MPFEKGPHIHSDCWRMRSCRRRSPRPASLRSRPHWCRRFSPQRRWPVRMRCEEWGGAVANETEYAHKVRAAESRGRPAECNAREQHTSPKRTRSEVNAPIALVAFPHRRRPRGEAAAAAAAAAATALRARTSRTGHAMAAEREENTHQHTSAHSALRNGWLERRRFSLIRTECMDSGNI